MRSDDALCSRREVRSARRADTGEWEKRRGDRHGTQDTHFLSQPRSRCSAASASPIAVVESLESCPLESCPPRKKIYAGSVSVATHVGKLIYWLETERILSAAPLGCDEGAAAGAAALACGNAACGKALAPPLLQCSKCKAEAYCCKACQVGDPAAPAAHRAPRARSCSLTRARSLPPCLHPPAARLPRGRPGTSTSAARRGRARRRRSSGAPRGGQRAQRPRARRRG